MNDIATLRELQAILVDVGAGALFAIAGQWFYRKPVCAIRVLNLALDFDPSKLMVVSVRFGGLILMRVAIE